MTLIEQNNYIQSVLTAHHTDKVICQAAVTILLENMNPNDRVVAIRQIENGLDDKIVTEDGPHYDSRKTKFINALNEIT